MDVAVIEACFVVQELQTVLLGADLEPNGGSKE